MQHKATINICLNPHNGRGKGRTPGVQKQQLIATHMQQRLFGNEVHYCLHCRQQHQQSSSSLPLDFAQAIMLRITFTAASEV